MDSNNEGYSAGEYSPEEKISVQPVFPRFACPKCYATKWEGVTTFQTPYKAKLWRGKTLCLVCKNHTNWLIDPDRTMEEQTPKMHRPLGS